MNKHILVTGGAGYIGSHVVKQLLESKHEVTILDNLSTGFSSTIDTLKNVAKKNSATLHFIELDLADKIAVENVFKNKIEKDGVIYDSVIHFAASLIVPQSVTNPIDYYLNNTVNGTNLIKMCITYGVKRFIFSSTATVYGNVSEDDIPIHEGVAISPINPYGHTKQMIEQILSDSSNAYENFSYVVLRYFNVAGADKDGQIGQSTENATHLIKVAAQAVLGQRESVSVFGQDYSTEDGTCLRDYIHVDDLADAHIKALEYLSNGNESNIFNCGYGHGFSVYDVLNRMKKVSGVNFNVIDSPRRDGDPDILIADSAKIRNKMNWNPKYDDLEYICKTALNWEKSLLQ